VRKRKAVRAKVRKVKKRRVLWEQYPPPCLNGQAHVRNNHLPPQQMVTPGTVGGGLTLTLVEMSQGNGVYIFGSQGLIGLPVATGLKPLVPYLFFAFTQT